jgi:hypothetical protein
VVKPKVELVGLEDVERIVNQLPKKFQQKVIRAALKEASKPMVDQAKTNLESHPWGDSRYTTIKARTEKGIPGVELGHYAPKRGKRPKLVWRAMGAYWLEWGTMEQMTKPREPGTRSLATAQRRVGSLPSKRGRVPAIGWLRKAINQTDEQMEEKYKNILWGQLNKALLRHAKKIKWSGLQ